MNILTNTTYSLILIKIVKKNICIKIKSMATEKNASKSQLSEYISKLWTEANIKYYSKLYYIREIFEHYWKRWGKINDIEALDSLENDLGMYVVGFFINAKQSNNKANIKKWQKYNKLLECNNPKDIIARINIYYKALNKLTLDKLIEFIKIQKVNGTPFMSRCAPEKGINGAPVWQTNDIVAKHITADLMTPLTSDLYEVIKELESKKK